MSRTEQGETPAARHLAETDQGFVLESSNARHGYRRYHKPDETGGEPACNTTLSAPDAHWRERDHELHILFSDPCKECFGGAAE